MKCRICGSKAIISLRRHNTSFCHVHFNEFFLKQVEKAIKKYSMFSRDEEILVCVSGGKDSLALWDALNKLNYKTKGFYIHLGIEDYSEESLEKVETFAEKNHLPFIVKRLGTGKTIPELSKKSGRKKCSVCGIVKRYFFNKIPYEENIDVVATGHNMDDEASRLLGNILKWDLTRLSKHEPVLKAEGMMLKRKVKPLMRLTDYEIATYALANGIDYIQRECPMSKGATSIYYKNVLNRLEEKSPGTKQYFYHQFLKNIHIFQDVATRADQIKRCNICGMESFSEICSYCRLMEKISEG